MRWFPVLMLAAALGGCAAGAPPAESPAASAPHTQLGSPFADHPSPASGLLVLDSNDLGMGTTIEFHHVPTAQELHDASLTSGFRHLAIVLARWPQGFEELEPLNQVPPEADCIVVLPGYPDTRQSAEAWNLVQARLRLVVVADGPPANGAIINDLNLLRGLDRVIATMDEPSRAGFERLQRPLSFRRVID